MKRWFSKNAAAIRTAEFGLSFASTGLAISFVSDMAYLVVFLTFGWLFAGAGLLTSSFLTTKQKFALCFGALAVFVGLGFLTRNHYESGVPDVTAHFDNKGNAILFVNNSGGTALNVSWQAVFWDLAAVSSGKNFPGRIETPVQIPTQAFTFLAPHSDAGPQMPTWYPTPPNRQHTYFGSIGINCSNCRRGHTYFVLLQSGGGGWSFEVASMKNGHVLGPRTFLASDVSEFIQKDLGWTRLENTVPIPTGR